MCQQPTVNDFYKNFLFVACLLYGISVENFHYKCPPPNLEAHGVPLAKGRTKRSDVFFVFVRHLFEESDIVFTDGLVP